MASESKEELTPVVAGAGWHSPSHSWEQEERHSEFEEAFDSVPSEGDRTRWMFVRCKWCGTRLAAQILPFRTEYIYKWQDESRCWRGVWLMPTCEELVLKPVQES